MASDAIMAGRMLYDYVCVADFVCVSVQAYICIPHSVCDAGYSVCICHFRRVCCTDVGHVNTGLATKDALTAPCIKLLLTQ